MFDEEKIRSIIYTNINLINDYLVYLSEEDINKFYGKMEELFFFYGFSLESVHEIVESRSSDDVPTNKLAEFESITNGMLFRLKYKMIPKALKKKGFTVNRVSEV